MTTDPHAALVDDLEREIHRGLKPLVGRLDWAEDDTAIGSQASRIVGALLPIVLREKAGAWDEATRIALDFAYLNDDGITLYLRPPNNRNPYREEEATDGR